MTRNLVVLALAVVTLANACTSEPWGCGMGSACPAMADVDGARYAVSGAVDLPGIEAHLTPYAPISASNMSAAFADQNALAVDGVDPRVLLVVRSVPSHGEPGAFRELWSLADDPFPVEFCHFMTAQAQAVQPECAAAPGT
jgi:hypothetical protein